MLGAGRDADRAAAAARARGSPSVAEVGRAHAGLRKVQLHPLGRSGVTREGSGDRTDLLVPGRQQERRSSSVGLHPDDVEVLVRVRQQLLAVRRDGSAGVQVGIDQRRQPRGRLHRGIQVQVYLAEHVQVRAETGGRGDRVHLQAHGLAVPGGAGDRHGAVVVRRGRECGDRELADEPDDAGGHSGLQGRPVQSAGRQPVGVAAAVEPGRGAAADGPGDLGLGVLVPELGQSEQSVGHRMAHADDERVPSGEALALAAQHVGERTHEPGAGQILADRPETGRAERVRVAPGARRVAT